MATTYYPITGVKVPGFEGQIVPRVNINTLATDASLKIRFHLYLIGLQKIQHELEDPNHPLSYYRISGIHGLPQNPWPAASSPGSGFYCYHGDARFATWHRPYLLLIEQRIVEEAVGVVKALQLIQPPPPASIKLNDWLKEASKVRLPYWDWTSDASLPPITTQPTFNIQLPAFDASSRTWSIKTTTLTPNPLYEYRFQSLARIQEDFKSMDATNIGYTSWMSTRRCPDKDGNNHFEVANKQLTDPVNGTEAFKASMKLLFETVHEYGPFSSTRWHQSQSQAVPSDLKSIITGGIPAAVHTYNSLEDCHDNIHFFAGTNVQTYEDTPEGQKRVEGHMGEVPVAGFDPIFWLHHANVDRLYAIWQTINPQSVYQHNPGETVQDADHFLLPFQKPPPAGVTVDIWQNKDVQRIQTSGTAPTVRDYFYTYPELDVKVPASDPGPAKGGFGITGGFGLSAGISAVGGIALPALEAAANAAFRALYAKPDDLLKQHYKLEPPKSSPNLRLPLQPSSLYRREWFAFLRHKSNIPGNFAVLFFLGDVDPNPATWFDSPNLVGKYGTFINSVPETCSNCKAQRANDQYITGTVPLTQGLVHKGVELDLELDVERYFATNLHWRLIAPNATEIASDEVDFKVGIASYTVEVPLDITKKIVGSGFKFHVHATLEKALRGGYSLGDLF
ncbi:hypothetical protein RUND412_006640 [Rhizina undulata]